MGFGSHRRSQQCFRPRKSSLWTKGNPSILIFSSDDRYRLVLYEFVPRGNAERSDLNDFRCEWLFVPMFTVWTFSASIIFTPNLAISLVMAACFDLFQVPWTSVILLESVLWPAGIKISSAVSAAISSSRFRVASQIASRRDSESTGIVPKEVTFREKRYWMGLINISCTVSVCTRHSRRKFWLWIRSNLYLFWSGWLSRFRCRCGTTFRLDAVYLVWWTDLPVLPFFVVQGWLVSFRKHTSALFLSARGDVTWRARTYRHEPRLCTPVRLHAIADIFVEAFAKYFFQNVLIL